MNFLGMSDESFRRIYDKAFNEMIPHFYAQREEAGEIDPNPIEEVHHYTNNQSMIVGLS